MPREQHPPAPVPESRDLTALGRAVRDCRACGLWENATQAVFGEGRRHSRVMLVGEQPGDKEDRQGRPFVGPAGRLLDRALDLALIDRGGVYVTNAVKHFKWTPDPHGKRRIHKAPNGLEMAACRPWLAAEIEAVDPALIVALGATAAKTLFGPDFRVSQQRGQLFELPGPRVGVATVHPSAVLRAPDAESRDLGLAELAADLRKAALAVAERRR